MDYLILLSSIGAGALTVIQFRLEERSYVKLFNSFTGAYLLAITFLHLLPELYERSAFGGQASHYYIGALILSGFFVQIVLDSFSMGVEHGHSLQVHNGHDHDDHAGHSHGTGDHHHHDHRHESAHASAALPIGVLMGLCLHAFVEAMALGDPHTHHDPASRQMLLWSIVLHNYPVSIVLLVMLLRTGLSRGKALGYLGLFAAMAPIGMAISSFTDLSHHTRELTAIVIGIFMHISTTILFESSDGHRFNRAKVVAIVGGVGLGSLTVMFH